MKLTELDYDLPRELIAQHPCPERSRSRLLVLDRASREISHRFFSDIGDYLQPGDCLVVNDSKVLPARFTIQRQTGGRIEGLFLFQNGQGVWQVLLKGASRLKPGEEVRLICSNDHKDIPHLNITVKENIGKGHWLLQPQTGDDAFAILEKYGRTPLPPYIRRQENDITNDDYLRYQTIFARQPGSVAAPTAGLHFSCELLETLTARGIRIARVTLHVGLGTFKAIETEDIDDHQMHAEYYQLLQRHARTINDTRQQGRKIIAVGTTSVRTLETLAENGQVRPASGWTSLFITPGFRFQVVDALITNFHLPRTSLLALVCAFAGIEPTFKAYRQAIRHKYRFYSYGDAMLIIGAGPV